MSQRTHKVRDTVVLVAAFLALLSACIGVMALTDNGDPRTPSSSVSVQPTE